MVMLLEYQLKGKAETICGIILLGPMVGNGTYDVPAESWLDDTSMVIATLESIFNYRYNHLNPLNCGSSNDNSIGNGSLMKILLFVLFGICHNETSDQIMSEVSHGSLLIHAHSRAILACKIYA